MFLTCALSKTLDKTDSSPKTQTASNSLTNNSPEASEAVGRGRNKTTSSHEPVNAAAADISDDDVMEERAGDAATTTTTLATTTRHLERSFKNVSEHDFCLYVERCLRNPLLLRMVTDLTASPASILPGRRLEVIDHFEYDDDYDQDDDDDDNNDDDDDKDMVNVGINGIVNDPKQRKPEWLKQLIRQCVDAKVVAYISFDEPGLISLHHVYWQFTGDLFEHMNTALVVLPVLVKASVPPTSFSQD